MAGADLAGIAVHIASRVESLAEPGEILVSGTVHDLVAGSGLRFEDRGRHHLTGIEGDWPVFAVDG
jgi:class 3 adenylate cyclase